VREREIEKDSRALVTHTSNPSFSGGLQLEASPGKYFLRPYLEKTFTKIGLVE
jgi:hypothetical protein